MTTPRSVDIVVGMSELTTPKEVIAALGGLSEVARIAQTTNKAVWNWQERGFPAETFLVMSDALERAGHKAPPTLWRQILNSEVA